LPLLPPSASPLPGLPPPASTSALSKPKALRRPREKVQAMGTVQATVAVPGRTRTLTLTLTPTRALSPALGRTLSLSLGRALSLSVGRARTCAGRWRGTWACRSPG